MQNLFFFFPSYIDDFLSPLGYYGLYCVDLLHKIPVKSILVPGCNTKYEKVEGTLGRALGGV